MGDFYKVHCTNCGEVMEADRMAVNLDNILRTHLDKMAARNVNRTFAEAKELFDEIRIGMYLTCFEMAQMNGIMDRKGKGILDKDGTIHLSCRHILNFIQERYKVHIETDAADEKPSEAKKDIIFPSDLFDASDLDAVDGKMSWKEDNSFKISEDVLDSLCLKMLLYSEKDIDEKIKRNSISKLLQFLVEEKDFLLLECRFDFSVSQDDKGGKEFLSSLKVTYFDNDTVAYNHMVCPNCGESFFIDAGKYEEKIIVMLGSSRVGKTAYLAALVNELKPKYGRPKYPNITVIDTLDKQYTFFKNTVLEQYIAGRKILKTDEKKEAVALFSLEIVINGIRTILTFVDLPGEVFVPRNKEELASGEASGRFIINHRKICYSADAFWFCIDPVQLDQRLRFINEHNDTADKVELDMDLVLSNITNSLQLMGNRKTEAPTAIIITKSDLIDPENRLYNSNGEREQNCLVNNTMFLHDRFYSIAENVKRYMESDQVKNITAELDNIFANKNYFAVAAYGMNVEEDKPKGRKPYGIMLPFLWTMTAFGYFQPVRYILKMEKTGSFFNRKETPVAYYEEVEEEKIYAADFVCL